MEPFDPHQPAQQVRMSGNPGVRSRQTSASGMTTHARASGVPHVGENRAVPLETLARVRQLLTEEHGVRAADDIFRELHEVLEPWL